MSAVGINLAGEVAVVVGGGRGLGRTLCEVLASCGAVCVPMARTEDEVNETARLVQANGGRAEPVTVDASDWESFRAAIDDVVRSFGKIDILVHCVSARSFDRVVDLDVSEWRRVVDVNLNSGFISAKAVLPHMIDRRKGRIINISSRLGIEGKENRAPYSAAKAGLIHFSKCLALEVASYGITVNSVLPGLLDTPVAVPAIAKGVEAKIPLGRVGKLEEVAWIVAFLASSLSSYMTGAVVSVDGGWSIT